MTKDIFGDLLLDDPEDIEGIDHEYFGSVLPQTETLVFHEDEPVFDDGLTAETCPKCGAFKKWRRNTWGGKFLGCQKFPKCDWTSYRKNLEKK